ncbi:MAG: MOSC domain-containing protein, partial [Nitrospinae bacterium]|nr:MOSC domain-containing protein [Nitrospinota bacterium]
GYIVSINISEKKGTKKSGVGKAFVKKGFGIQGDAHGGDWHRQISLLAKESIEKIKTSDLYLKPGDFAENLTTRGIDLSGLKIGTSLSIGRDVIIDITQIGKECHDRCAIYHRIGDCVMPREGLFAKVKRGGWIQKGDEIMVVTLLTSHC